MNKNYRKTNQKNKPWKELFCLVATISIFLSAIFTKDAVANDYSVPLKNCSAKELTAFYHFKSLEPSSQNYEQTQPLYAKVTEFVKSKTKDNGKPIQEQLSKEDNVKLNSMLEKLNSFEIRNNIEKIYFRDKALLIGMIGIVQDEDMNVKEMLNKDPNLLALFLSINNSWIDKSNAMQKPFYANKENNTCNIYTLALQIQDESASRINASAEEIKALSQDAVSIMEKVNNPKVGLELLTPNERQKYNRMKDVFPKLSKYRNTFDYLERIKAIAYVADLRYQNAVEVWTRNLGDVSSVDKSLEKKFASNAKYASDFKKIYQYLILFDRSFPYKEFEEKAFKSPNDLFSK